VYQDIPLYTLDEFSSHAPVEMRTEDVMVDEHQLMLNRLNLELLERQKWVYRLHIDVLYTEICQAGGKEETAIKVEG
jgi:hypothetical protein